MELHDDKNRPVTSDFRGEIRRFNIDGAMFNVLTTKAGMLRSGDFHDVEQYNLVLKGEVELTLRINDKDVVSSKAPNDFIIIPPKTPHLYKALSDCVMLEWWKGKFKVHYFKPYRKLVEAQVGDNEK